jgi:hypothetical protein
MRATAEYEIQWVNSINQLSVELNALMTSENSNSLMTLFILKIKIKSSCSSFIEIQAMMNTECMLNIIHHSLVKCLNKIENIHSWKFKEIFFDDKSMQLHETIVLDLIIQNFNDNDLCILKTFIIAEYTFKDLMLNLSFFEKHNFIHKFAHQHLCWRILCAQNERKRKSHQKSISDSCYKTFHQAKLTSSLFACNIHQLNSVKKVTLKFLCKCNHQKKWEVLND